MLRKLVLVLLLTSVFLACTYQTTCFALTRAVPETTKEAIVKKYLDGRTLATVEGLWTWNYNGFNFEVAIIQNTTTVYKDFEYIGIITRGFRDSEIGEVKFALRTSGVKGVYPGAYIIQYQDFWGNQDTYNTNFIMAYSNLIETKLPDARYQSQRVVLIKNYPASTPSAKAAGQSSGTGFFITNTIIATNYHVIEDAKELEVTFGNDTRLPATVIAKDPSNDLALLRVTGLEQTVVPLPLGSVKDTKEGAPVTTVGYPMPDKLGTRAKISEGIINSLTGMGDDIRLFQISIPVQPGNSGGPLLNNKGQVIGIVNSGLLSRDLLIQRGTVPQNVNFAIKINYINNLLNILPEDVKLAAGTTETTFDTEQMMERAKKAVVFIIATH
jgi:S1-C subfamily serine protease